MQELRLERLESQIAGMLPHVGQTHYRDAQEHLHKDRETLRDEQESEREAAAKERDGAKERGRHRSREREQRHAQADILRVCDGESEEDSPDASFLQGADSPVENQKGKAEGEEREDMSSRRGGALEDEKKATHQGRAMREEGRREWSSERERAGSVHGVRRGSKEREGSGAKQGGRGEITERAMGGTRERGRRDDGQERQAGRRESKQAEDEQKKDVTKSVCEGTQTEAITHNTIEESSCQTESGWDVEMASLRGENEMLRNQVADAEFRFCAVSPCQTPPNFLPSSSPSL